MEHVVNFLKLVLRVLKNRFKNKKNLTFKYRLKHLKRKCFNVLRQKQSCSHEVKIKKMVVRTNNVLVSSP